MQRNKVDRLRVNFPTTPPFFFLFRLRTTLLAPREIFIFHNSPCLEGRKRCPNILVHRAGFFFGFSTSPPAVLGVSLHQDNSTMSPRPRSAIALERRGSRGSNSYRCRVCNKVHPLKKCRRFLRLSDEKRLRAVLANRYCPNCLAHEHSDGGCQRGDRCKTCGQDHHTLLHLSDEPRSPRQSRQETRRSRLRGSPAPRPSSTALRRSATVPQPASAAPRRSSAAPRPSSAAPRRSSAAPRPSSAAPRRSAADPRPSSAAPRRSSAAQRSSSAAPRRSAPAPQPSSGAPRQSTVAPRPSPAAPKQGSAGRFAAAAPSLSSLLQRHSVNILPTALVRIQTETQTFDTAALIDPCTPVSCIDASLAACFRLPTTSVGEEQICAATVRSKADNEVQLDVVFKVEPRVRIRTPVRELSEAVSAHFRDVMLADERFYLPATISVVLGADMYPRVMQPGFLKIHEGLPVAQSTVFGWVVSGACHQP
ncbi:uncharacterized protein [Drosophila kikkawai]|uniref:Uncharacterized protein isoform X2 n=1 Tax=Drosophila kikkawai TaxID=30033 RepID=A0ABM4GH37_DROKI